MSGSIIRRLGLMDKSKPRLLPNRLTADDLQRRLDRALLHYTFLYGQGAPLTFLWIVGSGFFLLIWPNPTYAALWTGVVLVLAMLCVRDQRKNRELRRYLLIAGTKQRIPTDELRDPALRQAVDQGIALYVEIAIKALDLRRQDEAPGSAGVTADAEGLVQVQLASARQVEELRRLLSLTRAPSRGVPDETAPDSRDSTNGMPARTAQRSALLEHTVAAIEKEVSDAEGLVIQVGQQLETLALQLVRLEQRAGDHVAAAHVTRQTSETLDRLNAIVDARRKAADEVINTLMS